MSTPTPTDMNELIGERVRFYRTSRKLSLEHVAEKLPTPITGAQLARYETGQSRWPADTLVGIARILRTDIRLLVGLEDGKHEGKSSPEWDAEKYKCIMLELPEKNRKIIYKIIDGIMKL